MLTLFASRLTTRSARSRSAFFHSTLLGFVSLLTRISSFIMQCYVRHQRVVSKQGHGVKRQAEHTSGRRNKNFDHEAVLRLGRLALCGECIIVFLDGWWWWGGGCSQCRRRSLPSTESVIGTDNDQIQGHAN